MTISKKLSATLGAFALCALLGLSGCGDSTGSSNAPTDTTDTTTPVEPVPAEAVPVDKALNTESIWFGIWSHNADFGKTGVMFIFIFDGKGNVTPYHVGFSSEEDLTLNDLDGLSDDEIIELAKQRDRYVITTDIPEWVRTCHDGEWEEELILQKSGMTCDEAAQKFENADYEEPKPVPFTIEHPGGGGPDLEYTSTMFDLSFTSDTYGEYVPMEKAFLFSPSWEDKSIYPAAVGENYYAGYDGLVTRVSKNHPGFD